MTKNNQIGNLGENACAGFLASRGWKILKRNLRTPYGEVDIITERHGCLWAVEVKTRKAIDRDRIPGIISLRQRRRVRNGLVWFARECGKNTCRSMNLYLALIDLSEWKICFFQLPAED